MKHFLKIYSLLILLFYIVLVKPTKAQTLPIYYDFETGSYAGWNIISGNWNVSNIFESMRFGATSTTPIIEAQMGDINWTNYEINLDIYPTKGFDRNLAFRVTNQRTQAFGLDLPVAYGLHLSTNYIYIQKLVQNYPGDDPRNIEEPIHVDRGIPNNSVTHLKIRAYERNIKVYYNNENTPVIEWTDNSTTPILSGKISLLITTGASGTTEVWFDNVSVTEIPAVTLTPTPSPTLSPSLTPSPTPTPTLSPTPNPTPLPNPSPISTPVPLPSLNVPDLKQYDDRWKNTIYDTATQWSSNPTIEHWGCALTSATMILNYYGRNITPNNLNSWLKSQPDGYIGNGFLNWLAVSRYSKQTSNSTSASLEYLRLSGNQSLLINELKDSRPSILQVPGHFIVAKSQTPDSFGINDPAYSNRPTLSSYSNTFSSIGSYVPSFTNLSYFMITSDNNIDVNVYGPGGNKIDGYSYFQEPIQDNINTSSSNGNGLNIFEYPKPLNGSYKIEVTGTGLYDLSTYVYDTNGNVTLDKEQGIVSPNQINFFTTSVGVKKPNTEKLVTINSLIEEVKTINNMGYFKKKNLYNNILKDLTQAKRFMGKNHNLHSTGFLWSAAVTIERNSRYIENSSRIILLEDIKSLILSFWK